MIHVFFLIRSLNIGGAERQLVELAKGLSKTNFKITICLFYNEGVLLKELHSIRNVKIITLDKSGRWDIFRFFFRLIRILKSLNPQILYSFLPEANIAGLIAGKISGVPRIVWGVRASNMDVSHYDWLAGISLWLSALMSRFPNAIIVNSHVGKEFHRSIGYNTNRMIVMPNGIGTDRFKPDHSAGLRVRDEWGIDEKTVSIGLVGRLDPMKDHTTFSE